MNEICAMIPQSFELSIREAPTLAQCFPKLGHEIASHDFQAYPTRPTTLDRNEPIFYLHSSGSTGFPKPIAETCNTMLGWCSLGMFPGPFRLSELQITQTLVNQML